MSRAHPPDGGGPPPSSRATPTIGWLRHAGSRVSRPASQASSGAPRRQPDARMVQSSARSRCLSTYGCPPITTRSSRAPDFPAPSVIWVRSVAPAMRSVTLANTTGASSIGRFHLGEQRGWPPPAAHHGVGHDVIIAHGEQVHVMGRVRHAVLGPAERVLHDVARAPVSPHCEPAELPELTRVREPA